MVHLELHSKSEVTRRPFTMVFASCLRAKSTTSSEKTSTTTFSQEERASSKCDTLLDGEERLLVRRVADDATTTGRRSRRPLDDVDVTVRDRVVAAGADGRDQCENTVIRAEP